MFIKISSRCDFNVVNKNIEDEINWDNDDDDQRGRHYFNLPATDLDTWADKKVG